MVCFIHFPQPKDNVLCKMHPLCMTEVLTGAEATLSHSFMHSVLVKLTVFQAEISLFFFFSSLVEWAQGGRKT